MGLVRVLKIPGGKDVDDEGRGVGSDWLLATIGTDDKGDEYYITTDGVRASDLCAFEFLEPEAMATEIVKMLNDKARALGFKVD